MKLKQIIFEGPEACGKSTQLQLLSEYLDSSKIKYSITKEPGSGGILAAKIRNMLLDPETGKITEDAELLLINAARAELYKMHRSEEYRYHLQLKDRSFASTRAYQGFGREMDLDYIQTITDHIVGDDLPEILFLFDIDPITGLKRAGARGKLDRFESEKLEFHKRVRRGYLSLTEHEKYKSITHLIDATRDINDIHKEICQKVKQTFPEYNYK